MAEQAADGDETLARTTGVKSNGSHDQVNPLRVFDKERISCTAKLTKTQSWHDIPSCKEEGLDVQYLMLRAMFPWARWPSSRPSMSTCSRG
jgi:tripartite-type tricarboxylate transporter receptor subunit TctC